MKILLLEKVETMTKNKGCRMGGGRKNILAYLSTKEIQNFFYCCKNVKSY
jgi:hypothetical protein